MDYIIGFWLALSSVSVVVWYVTNKRVDNFEKFNTTIRYRQSHVHNLVAPLLPPEVFVKKRKPTQASKHEASTNIRVIIMDDMAYWIKDHTFYSASMGPDGTVDKETTTQVDTMHMNKVQLDKMVFIVDKLTEGLQNDNGDPGH